MGISHRKEERLYEEEISMYVTYGYFGTVHGGCGNGQDKDTGAATETGVESTEGIVESTGTSAESTEAGNAGTQQESGDVASALQTQKKQWQMRWVMITGRIPRSRRKC